MTTSLWITFGKRREEGKRVGELFIGVGKGQHPMIVQKFRFSAFGPSGWLILSVDGGGSAFSVPTKKVNGRGNAGRFAADADRSGLPLSVLHVVELKVSHYDYKCRIGSMGRGVKADGGEQHRS